MRETVARYFVLCLAWPDTLNICRKDEVIEVREPESTDQESLSSGQAYVFTRMQVQLWECAHETNFLLDRQFMASLTPELQNDDETDG